MDKQKDFGKGWEEYKAKKKQEVEEMYQDFLNYKFQNSSPETFSYKGLFEHLYRAGYRKIPQNAVVLTEEESITAWKNGNCNAHAIYGLAYEQARKETAEKIADWLDNEKGYCGLGFLIKQKFCTEGKK